MDYNEIIDQLTWKIIDFDKGDPKRIQHLLKVHRFAQLIARAEHVDEHTRQVLECAAVFTRPRPSMGAATASCRSRKARPQPGACCCRSACPLPILSALAT